MVVRYKDAKKCRSLGDFIVLKADDEVLDSDDEFAF